MIERICQEVVLKTLLATSLALSIPIRRQAIREQGSRCADFGNGVCQGYLEAAHWDHNRETTEDGIKYNSTHAVVMRCTRHHILEHKRREGENGLDTKKNRVVITMMEGKLKKYLQKYG